MQHILPVRVQNWSWSYKLISQCRAVVVSWVLSNGNISLPPCYEGLVRATLCIGVSHLTPTIFFSMCNHVRIWQGQLYGLGWISGLHSESALSSCGEVALSYYFEVVLHTTVAFFFYFHPSHFLSGKSSPSLLGVPLFAAALLFTKLGHACSYSESGKTVRWPPT